MLDNPTKTIPLELEDGKMIRSKQNGEGTFNFFTLFDG